VTDLSKNTPPQFYVEPGQVSGGRVYLTGDNLKHAMSQRLKPGQEFRVVVEMSKPAEVIEAEVIEVSRRCLVGKIKGKFEAEELPYRLHLYPAILKGDKFDLVIRSATELGVTSITPVITVRTIPRLDESKLASRRERWQKIARAAAEQSSRPAIPEVREAASFAEIMDSELAGVPLLAMERREVTKTVAEAVGPAKEVSILIGPEGGFDAREIELAFRKGLHPITLGPYILRAETASVAACAIIIDHILNRV